MRQTRSGKRLLTIAMLGAGLMITLPAATQPSQSTLYTFRASTDGGQPEGGVIWGSDNVLYGTADRYGTNDNGTIFRLTPPASSGDPWTFKALYRLQGGTGGGYPLGLVQDAAGNLYGYALDGGSGGYGIVFELKKPKVSTWAWLFETLYSFQGGTDGADPSGLSLQPDGTLVGTTDRGGSGPCTDPIDGSFVGCGTIFQLTPPTAAGGAWTEAILHSFTRGSDGAIPVGNPLNVGGALYGVTVQGGAGNCTDSDGILAGCGTVYKLVQVSPSVWTESVAYAFQGGSQGESPLGNLGIDRAGALYGVTGTGGVAHSPASDPNGDGIVFRLTQAAGATGLTLQVIHTLGAAGDGRSPEGGVLVLPNGTVFGTTYLGPDGYYGTLFRVTPPTVQGGKWGESVLAKFPSPGGVYPSGQLARNKADGTLYGITIWGGHANAGTVFRVVP